MDRPAISDSELTPELKALYDKMERAYAEAKPPPGREIEFFLSWVAANPSAISIILASPLPSPVQRTALQLFQADPRAPTRSLKSMEAYLKGLAQFIETAPRRDILPLAEDVNGRKLSEREKQEVFSKLVKVAEGIRRKWESTSPPYEGKGTVEADSFTPEKVARLRRASRRASPDYKKAHDLFHQGELGSAQDAINDSAVSVVPLMLAPPPPGSKYGSKARDSFLLPSDRKHCECPGCPRVVSDRQRYCPEHSALFQKERRRMKKLRQRDRAKLRRSNRLAEPGEKPLALLPEPETPD